MNARKLMALLIATLALVAAGCGGDSKSEATPATVETTAATETVTTETSTAEDTTSTADSTSTSGIDTSALSGRCAELAGVSAKLSESLGGQTADLQDASKLFDQLADQVPDEIKADYQVIAENFSKIAEALKGVDLTSGQTPSPEALAKLQEVTASMDSAEVQKASQHIEAWVKANC